MPKIAIDNFIYRKTIALTAAILLVSASSVYAACPIQWNGNVKSKGNCGQSVSDTCGKSYACNSQARPLCDEQGGCVCQHFSECGAVEIPVEVKSFIKRMGPAADDRDGVPLGPNESRPRIRRNDRRSHPDVGAHVQDG
jgi:hypothetical protein